MKPRRKHIHTLATFTLTIATIHAEITPQMIADGEATMQQALLANEQTFIRTEEDQIASLNAISAVATADAAAEQGEVQVLRNEPGLAALFNDPSIIPVRVEGGNLVFITSDNVAAADTISLDNLWPGGSSPLPDVTGAGRTIGIWEAGGGVFGNHVELNGRVTQMDNPILDNLPLHHSHATQVAGTLAGSGTRAIARGGAYQSTLRAYTATNDIGEMAAAAAAGLRLSNHSYSQVAGWRFISGLGWVWFGSIGAGEDARFGIYERESRQIDLVAYEAKNYLSVYSSGNEASDFGPVSNTNGLIPAGTSYWRAVDDNGDGIPDRVVSDTVTHPSDGGLPQPASTIPPNAAGFPKLGLGFDTLKPSSVAKNNLAIGAIDDVVGGVTAGTDPNVTYFSSRGPTDDGRIKPDLVANGWRITTSSYDSANATATNLYTDASGATGVSGTSFSAPSVTSALAATQELYTLQGGSELRSASWKALFIHTADDATALPAYMGAGAVALVGPDYPHGWGVPNATRAGQVLAANAGSESKRVHLRQHTLFEDNVVEIPIKHDGSSPQMKVTIAWTDPAYQDTPIATASEGVPVVTPTTIPDNATLRLVNDLDIRVVTPSGAILTPWVLDPANPLNAATVGDNFRDNVEQIVISTPVAGIYKVRVTHKGTLRDLVPLAAGHPQFDPAIPRYELVPERHQAFTLGVTGNAEVLGDAIKIVNFGVIGNAVYFEWTSTVGLRYQWQQSNTLQPNSWINIGPVIDATVPITPLVLIKPAETKMFYRVREVGTE
jgi:hypothetical protein